MRAWEKNSTKRGEEKTLLGQSLRRLEMQARNQNQGSRLIRDTFPLHFLLAIKLYCVILTCCQWHPEENLLNLKVFLSSPLVRARFFPNLSSRVITRVFSQALIIDFSKKLKEFQIFEGVSNLVFIVLCCKFPELRTIPVRESFQSPCHWKNLENLHSNWRRVFFAFPLFPTGNFSILRLGPYFS
jgi:hypothetical protein